MGSDFFYIFIFGFGFVKKKNLPIEKKKEITKQKKKLLSYKFSIFLLESRRYPAEKPEAIP